MGNQFKVLGIKVDPISVDQLHELISTILQQNTKAIITNVNIHAVNIAYSNRWFRDFLNSSRLTFCDGAGVMLGAKILGHNIPERITYAEWAWRLADYCEEHEYTLYLLGGKPGVSEKAAKRLRQYYPKLKLTGTNHGYFDKEIGSEENRMVIKAINKIRPNILIVGFGMPLQEKWLKENWHAIEANIGLTGGAVFDYISGELRRGPQWMTDHGLEWLARLIIEPKRLWKRYIIGNPLFFLRVLLQKLGVLKFS